MINERNARLFCSESLSTIENYDEALSSDEMYECHHRLEVQGPWRNSR